MSHRPVHTSPGAWPVQHEDRDDDHREGPEDRAGGDPPGDAARRRRRRTTTTSATQGCTPRIAPSVVATPLPPRPWRKGDQMCPSTRRCRRRRPRVRRRAAPRRSVGTSPLRTSSTRRRRPTCARGRGRRWSRRGCPTRRREVLAEQPGDDRRRVERAEEEGREHSSRPGQRRCRRSRPGDLAR